MRCPSTPVFPAWSGSFAAQVRTLRSLCGPSLHPLELLFGSFIPRWRLSEQDEGPHSRNRCWNLSLTFWTFLWQVAQPGSSCREAIRQAQALCRAQGRRSPADKNSPYCQARGALPLQRLEEIHDALLARAGRLLAAKDLWCGHQVIVLDGTTVTAPDTAANQEAYPQQSVQKPGCGFPILRILAFLNLSSGLLSAWALGPWRQSEVGLLEGLWDSLRPGQVLLGDRGFCNWGLLAQCLQRQVHAVFRVKGKCRRDLRRGRHLSRDERLVCWKKPQCRGVSFSPLQWAALPQELSLRVVACRLQMPGFRTRKVVLVTTLLDSLQYPPQALSSLYFRRWAMELSLRNLKSTLQMEHLSCKTPQYLEREIRMHLLAHNLVRLLMLEAARRHNVALERISFAGSLAAARRYSEVLQQVRSARHRRRLYEELLRVLAADLVPDRPGRREPRAVKRRPKPYPLLTCHRHRFREIRHQNRYYRNSVFGPKYRTKP